jgi:hypothetical protein
MTSFSIATIRDLLSEVVLVFVVVGVVGFVVVSTLLVHSLGVLNSNASTRRFASSPLVIGSEAIQGSTLRILIPAASATRL